MARFPWGGLRYLPQALLVLIFVLPWSVLLVSLDLGRTTPAGMSLAWLASLVSALFGVLAWTGLYGILLRVASRPNSPKLPARIVLSVTPLTLALPVLIGVYTSDDLFHFLYTNPIPRALIVWIPVAVMAIGQEMQLIWVTRLPAPVQSWLRRDRTVPLLLFAAFAALYVFTAGGHLYSPDEKEMYQVTESVTRGWLATSHRDGIPEVENGQRLWSQYGLVPSLLAVPAYWVSSALGVQLEPPSSAFPIPNVAYPLVDLLVNPLATAATCALLYGLAMRLGFAKSTSLVLVLAFGLSTSAWVYSKTFFAQPVAASFLLGSAFFLVRRDTPSPRDFALAGLLLGLGVGTRFELPLVAFPLAALALRGVRRDSGKWLRSIVALVLVFAVVSMATAGWYNWVKTGSIFVTGYMEQTRGSDFGTKPYIAIFGTFFSSGFGFFTFNPITILGVFSLMILAVERRTEAVVFGTIVLAAAILYSVFNYWYGGFTWANRYMLIVLPFAVLPAGVLLERPWRTPISVLAVICAVLLGAGINLLGVLFDWNIGWLDLWGHGASLTQIAFDPHFSTIGAHLRVLKGFLSTGSGLDLYLYYKLGTPALALFVILFAGLTALAARAALSARSSNMEEAHVSLPGPISPLPTALTASKESSR